MAEHVGEARVYYYTRGRELSRSGVVRPTPGVWGTESWCRRYLRRDWWQTPAQSDVGTPTRQESRENLALLLPKS